MKRPAEVEGAATVKRLVETEDAATVKGPAEVEGAATVKHLVETEGAAFPVKWVVDAVKATVPSGQTMCF